MHTCILAMRLRYTVEEHLGEILAFRLPGSKHFEDTAIQIFCFMCRFSPSRLKYLHLKYNIYTLYKCRGLKLATLTNLDLIFHILLSE